MTEQELREHFENNKELFPNHPMDEGEVIKRKLFTRNEFDNYSWNDIRRDFKSFNEGYSLAQESIEKQKKEIEEAFQEKMELFDVISRIDSQLKEAVRHIEGLLEQGCSDNVDQFLAKYKGGEQ